MIIRVVVDRNPLDCGFGYKATFQPGTMQEDSAWGKTVRDAARVVAMRCLRPGESAGIEYRGRVEKTITKRENSRVWVSSGEEI